MEKYAKLIIIIVESTIETIIIRLTIIASKLKLIAISKLILAEKSRILG